MQAVHLGINELSRTGCHSLYLGNVLLEGADMGLAFSNVVIEETHL